MADTFTPLGQSFIIDAAGAFRLNASGVYLSKIDLFFASKDSSLPVVIDIRPLERASGLLTSFAVPFSRVVVPAADVNVSDDGSKPTPIIFPSPVYLLNGQNYAITITPAGNNPNYTVWVARLGDNDIVSGNRVTAQPASGTLFVSSNDITQTAIQEEDLKFRLYAAKFSKSSSGSVVLKNELRDYFVITDQDLALRRIGETVHGETLLVGTFANTKNLSVANSTTFAQGMTSGATGIVTYFGANRVRVRNVSLAAKFAGGEAIRIRTNNATTGGIVGNSSGGITSATTPTGKVAYYDTANYANVHLHVANVSYSNSGPADTLNRMFQANTWIRGQTNGYIARIASFRNIKVDAFRFGPDMLTPANTYVGAFAKMATSTSSRDSSYFRINLADNTYPDASRYIYSRSMESNTSATSSSLAANRSSEIKVFLTSNNDYVSPALDLRRSSLILVDTQINSNTDIGSSEDYVRSGGNAKARYITRRVTLADGQDAEDLKVYVTAYRPSDAQVFVYYKVLHREDSDTFDTARWIPMVQNTASGFTGTTVYSSDQNQDDFIELTYDVPTYSNLAKSGANNSNQGILEYRNSASARFVGFKYFCFKIVLTGSSSHRPPRIKDLRAIALQR